mmetsp:Transcript_9456/g.35410  ORF Transcript_9456/g.35410 Transcript_9456/m.35410 type:complete len:226 (+) Transcript_9456:665-1342(+)
MGGTRCSGSPGVRRGEGCLAGGVPSSGDSAPVVRAVSQTSSRLWISSDAPWFSRSMSDGSSSCWIARRRAGSDAQALPPPVLSSVEPFLPRLAAEALAKALRNRVCARRKGQLRPSPMPKWSCMRSMIPAPCFSASPKFLICARALCVIATPTAMHTHVKLQMPTTACTASSASAVHSSKSSISRVRPSIRTKARTHRRRFTRSRRSARARKMTSRTPPETCALT